MKNVIYIAELDADVDDVIAAEYLHRNGVLDAVVCDPMPNTPTGKKRKSELEKMGVKVKKTIPPNTKHIFVGGALTEVSRYIINHKVESLIMNGGFVGCNIVDRPLKKFEGKLTMRTFNFNCDVAAADRVLKSQNIGQILLVGKNVCHDPQNTMNGIWKTETPLLEKYHAKSTKLQHDLLACREGLIFNGLLDEESYLGYEFVHPYNKGLNGTMTQWGSKREKTIYRKVLAAVDWRNRRQDGDTRYPGYIYLLPDWKKQG